MLATNFQTFNKTDIAISKESASGAESEKKIFDNSVDSVKNLNELAKKFEN